MKCLFSPTIYNQLATLFNSAKWHLIAWSAFAFVLFISLELITTTSTPPLLIWGALFILFAALQALVLASFIFFFQQLPSEVTKDEKLKGFYRFIEWCEAVLFTLLLPLPSIVFMYAVFMKVI